MHSEFFQTPQNVNTNNQPENQGSNRRRNDDLIMDLRTHLNTQQNQQNQQDQQQNDTETMETYTIEQAHHTQNQNTQDRGALDRMEESQDFPDQGPSTRQIERNNVQDNRMEMGDMEIDPGPDGDPELFPRPARDLDINEGPSKKKTRDSGEAQENYGPDPYPQDDLATGGAGQMDTSDNETIQDIQTPMKTLVIDDDEPSQESRGNTTTETERTQSQKVSNAAVEARLQTPAWMGEVTLPTQPPIRLRLRDPTAWAALVTDWLNGDVNPMKVQTMAKFEAQLILQEQLSETVPEGNWSGFTTILQAQMVSGGLSVAEAKVDLSNQRQRQDFRKFLMKLQGPPAGNREDSDRERNVSPSVRDSDVPGKCTTYRDGTSRGDGR
jgi:hypothetical protein